MRFNCKHWDKAVVLLSFIGIWNALYFCAQNRLVFKEQLGLFMNSPEFFAQYLAKPAVLAEIIGDCLTQYFIKPFLGPLIITIVLFLLWAALRKTTFRIMGAAHCNTHCDAKNADANGHICTGEQAASLLALLVTSVEMVLCVHLQYPLSSTIGFLIAICIFNLFSKIGSTNARSIAFVILIPFTYWIAGMHAAKMALLLIAQTLIQDRKNILKGAGAAVAGLLIVLFMGTRMNLSATGALLYPIVNTVNASAVTLIVLIPLIVVAVTVRPLWCRKTGQVIVWGAVAVFVFAVSVINLRSPFEEYEASLSNAAAQKDWNKLLELAKQDTKDSDLSVFYRNLCFAKEGHLADSLMSYRQMPFNALQISVSKETPIIYALAAIDGYREVCDIPQATGAALLCNTLMPKGSSARVIRTLAELSIVTGDFDAAYKYLDILSKSRFYRKSAQELKSHLQRNEMSGDLLSEILGARETDGLFYPNNWIASLTNIVAEKELNKTALDYLLCSYLLGKNINSFINAFDRYYMPRFAEYGIPKLYMEALLSRAESVDEAKNIRYMYQIPVEMLKDWASFTEVLQGRRPTAEEVEKLDGTFWNYIASTNIEQ